MAIDARLQRDIMGRFATGVTVVTTRYQNGDITGMTANAVMSLSLDPPLVVVSVDKSATMHSALSDDQCYAINILTREQEHLSNRFAAPGPKDFSDLKIARTQNGRADFGWHARVSRLQIGACPAGWGSRYVRRRDCGWRGGIGRAVVVLRRAVSGDC